MSFKVGDHVSFKARNGKTLRGKVVDISGIVSFGGFGSVSMTGYIEVKSCPMGAEGAWVGSTQLILASELKIDKAKWKLKES